MVHSCLQLRLIRHEWGVSFFDVGASLKNYSCRLKRTKSCRSFGLKVDKLLAGLEQILPHKKTLLRVVPIKGIVAFGVTNLCGGANLKNYHPKRTIPLMSTALKSAFLWGMICFKPASNLSALGLKSVQSEQV